MTTQSENNSPALRILLLEDYSLDAELVKRHLTKKHPEWNIDHVRSRESFQEYLRTTKPDVVLSDYALPQFTGMEAYLTVKELGLHIPFIIVTGHLPEEVAIECIKEGIDDYIIKSSILRLDVAIQKAIQRRSVEAAKTAIAKRLKDTERRFESIFTHAGVALVEFYTEHKLIRSGDKDHQESSNLRRIVDSIEVTAVNSETLFLFDAENTRQFEEEFRTILNTNVLRYLISGTKAFEEGQRAVERTFEIDTFSGRRKSVKVKTVFDPARPHHFVVSFVDMTDVKEAEKRTLKITERLEDTVAQRMLELSELNERLRLEAEERNKINEAMRDNYITMTESIIAAKRIQDLILPSKSKISLGFKDAFVYMRPKDIVSGDFYWYHERSDERWIAGVDCTGHGVPGAFMSMIGSKMLTQTIVENGLNEPGEVLENINEYVISELKQHESSTRVSTGMDMSLLKFDYRRKTVHFAGAFQNLFHKRGDQLDVYKGDRRSLGGTFVHVKTNFQTIEIPFEENDTFYIMSDGYADQFGGPKHKKFTTRRLRELLQTLNDQSMYEQEVVIKRALQNWKGATEQIDDILFIGIRV